jgi:membrane-associated phospholipid phosphatase
MKWFSYVFHPIFIPLFATALYAWLDCHSYDHIQIWKLFIHVTVMLLVLPLLFFWLLHKTGQAANLMLPDVSQRKLPLLLQALLLSLLIERSVTIDLFPSLYFFFLAALFSVLLATIAAFFKLKPSLHLLGVAGLLTYLIGLGIHNQSNVSLLVALLLFIIGGVASSRLQMKAHTPKELVMGFVMGFTPGLFFFYFWL